MSVSMCLLCALFLVARQFKNPCDKKIEETVHPYRDPTLEPGLGCLGLSPCGQARHSQKNMGPPSCRSNTHRRCHRGWVAAMGRPIPCYRDHNWDMEKVFRTASKEFWAPPVWCFGGRHRTSWRDYISWLPCEFLGFPLDKLEEVVGMSGLLCCCPRNPALYKW